MILHSDWQPTPPRPGSADDALARGFDPDSLTHDRATPEPLTDEWQAALEGALVSAQHRGDDDLIDDNCGDRCDRCSERMCVVYGPEPRPCSTTCADCPCDCTGCLDQRQDLRDDLLRQLEREARP